MSELFILIVKVHVVFGIAQGLASFTVWTERKGSALIQDRIGANRAGAFLEVKNPILNFMLFPVRLLGVLGVINTLVCDAVKALFKEDFVPEGTNNFVHSLAPFIAALPVFMAYALIPFSPDFEIFGYQIRSQIASLDVGILFVLAMGCIAI